MSFEKQIESWITIDNRMKLLNEQMKELRDKKNTISQDILSHVEKNNLSQSTIKMNDTKIKFAQTNITAPLTFKYLENCLHNIIKNEHQVKQIIEYVKQKRETKTQTEIKRFS